jgi:hypothetical protein
VVQNTGTAGAGSSINIIGGNAGNSALLFSDTDAFNAGLLMYRHDVEAMSIYTNFNERVRIDSTGRVGIGTINPSNTLHLVTSGAGVALSVGRSDSPNYFNVGTYNNQFTISRNSVSNHALNINSNGNMVGINLLQTNPNPSSTLHVAGSALFTSWTAINFSNAANVTPTAPLEVSGTISATNAILSSLQTDAAGLGQVAMTSATVTGDFRVWGNLYVSGSQTIDGVSFANGGVNAVGTVTATAFSGDGSRLTNLNTGGFDDDRIVSGTAKVTANSTGYISLSTGGSDYGYLDTGGRLVIPGISTTTNQASFTSLYVSGNVGIGTATPSSKLHVAGAIRLGADASSTSLWVPTNTAMRTGLAGTNFYFDLGNVYFRDGNASSSAAKVIINGQIGLGNALMNTPSSSIHTTGAIRIAQESSTTLNTCDADRAGAIRWQGSQFQVCYGSGGWALLSSADVSGTIGQPDRIVSGTAQIIARNNADISVSTNMDVSGTLKLAGTGAEVCSAATIGTTRINPSTGRPEYCRW